MRKGFTLVEVLVTLAIIGVVAALTIPPLVAKINEKILEVQLKKAYYTLSELVVRAQQDSGVILNAKDFSYTNGHNLYSLYYHLKPYFISNFCKYTVRSSCNIESINLSDSGGHKQSLKSYRTYNDKNYIVSYYMDGGAFVLPDSTLIMLENYNDSTLMIHIDINGLGGKPNKWGHDLFTFAIDNNTGKLIPQGMPYSDYNAGHYFNGKGYCSNNNNASSQLNGISCSYYALKNICPSDLKKGYWRCLPK